MTRIRIRRFAPLALTALMATAALALPGTASAAERCNHYGKPVAGGTVYLNVCTQRSDDRTRAYAHSYLTVSDSSRVRLYTDQTRVASQLWNNSTKALRVDWSAFHRDFVWQGGGRRTYGTATVAVSPGYTFYGAGRATFDVVGDGKGDISVFMTTAINPI